MQAHESMTSAAATTRSTLEDILAKEEEHAEDLANLLATLDPTQKTD